MNFFSLVLSDVEFFFLMVEYFIYLMINIFSKTVRYLPSVQVHLSLASLKIILFETGQLPKLENHEVHCLIELSP